MELHRRQLLVAGVSLSGAAVAGCLSEGDPGSGAGESGDTTTGTDPDGSAENGDRGDDASLPEGLDRVDDPPYEIAEPDCDPPEDGRNPLWLCEHMAAEPSLPFEQAETSGAFFADEGLRLDESDGQGEYYATLLTEEADLERVRDGNSEASRLAAGTDFESEAVLVAQTGWGSGSVTPHVERVEETDDGVHAFGCERQPCVYTSDLTSRTVAVRFERPERLDAATVSLTVSVEKRINFAAGEGVVTLGDQSD
jgi:hypothetical protein